MAKERGRPPPARGADGEVMRCSLDGCGSETHFWRDCPFKGKGTGKDHGGPPRRTGTHLAETHYVDGIEYLYTVVDDEEPMDTRAAELERLRLLVDMLASLDGDTAASVVIMARPEWVPGLAEAAEAVGAEQLLSNPTAAEATASAAAAPMAPPRRRRF